jgi:GDP/UDP-N,N'-diacetylbacillosamine 2-epimerase (hydrolysing)
MVPRPGVKAIERSEASDGKPRTVCFVTGTRAEFGLMARTLSAIAGHPRLRLRMVATGMHLDRSRGYSVADIRKAGFKVDATVPWSAPAKRSAGGTAAATGRAMAGLAAAYGRLKADVVLVVGDRVEAFAAAAAGHVAGLCVAHVHGGDRAPGVVDDSLRHAITKLSHLHFPATAASADRLLRLGEDRWRVRRVGSPGIDGIVADAAPRSAVLDTWDATGQHIGSAFPLVVLHPSGGTDRQERANAETVLTAVDDSAFWPAVVVYPNNDPGSGGIVRCYETWPGGEAGPPVYFRNLARDRYLGLLRDAAVLVGNSSSGIIEAASFGTPVVNVGDRQRGRERGGNVVHVACDRRAIATALRRIFNRGDPVRYPRRNIYGSGRAAGRIADHLARVVIDDRLLRKLIAY